MIQYEQRVVVLENQQQTVARTRIQERQQEAEEMRERTRRRKRQRGAAELLHNLLQSDRPARPQRVGRGPLRCALRRPSQRLIPRPVVYTDSEEDSETERGEGRSRGIPEVPQVEEDTVLAGGEERRRIEGDELVAKQRRWERKGRDVDRMSDFADTSAEDSLGGDDDE